MFKYILTLLACAAMLYQTCAGAASMSREQRANTKIQAQQLKNNKLTYHPQAQRKRCKYNDQRCHKAQQRQYIRASHASAGRARRDGNFDRGNYDGRGDLYEGGNYDRAPSNMDGQSYGNGSRDFPGESNSEESFLRDHRE